MCALSVALVKCGPVGKCRWNLPEDLVVLIFPQTTTTTTTSRVDDIAEGNTPPSYRLNTSRNNTGNGEF